MTETQEQIERREKLSEFSLRACVQDALGAPNSPASVLSFMFGVDFGCPKDVERNMRTGQSVLDMRRFWFFDVGDLDELSKPFSELVRSAGQGKLVGYDWNRTVDGKMAQLVLCDQLSRSIFRGSQEAFAYDAQALGLARLLCDSLLAGKGAIEEPLAGEFYPPYLVFLQTALMHSECVEDHAQLSDVNDYADRQGPVILRDWFAMMRTGGEAHTRVVERFGRYPHRNAANGRINTAAEDAWLADVDNLPNWAKSQL